ncbi:MAG: GatB/YqeY domain-containing protein [gamma proteobacterium symbiont of Bathyaustriella thionipta]|nr:GatB/YqeY domain-containing protein [gamma proteobacterium symbiont of Bathyaustriella thionipta]
MKQRIISDMKAAMKAGEKPRLGTIRLITAAIKQVEVDERRELSDDDILAILNRMVKQRRDSISQYEKADRQDLADQEIFELDLIQTYLPAQLSEAEIKQAVENAVKDSGAASMRDMGKVMGLLNASLQGRADMSKVSGLVKQALS